MNLFEKLAEITSPLGIDYYEAMLNNGNDEMCDYVRLLVNEDNEAWCEVIYSVDGNIPVYNATYADITIHQIRVVETKELITDECIIEDAIDKLRGV